MGLPKLESCCILFDLKTGNIIMGCVNAVLTFFLVVLMSIEAYAIDVEETEFNKMDDLEKMAGLTGLYAMCVILLILFIAKLCFDVTFVFAVITERAVIIKAYFIMWVVFTIMTMSIFFMNVLNFKVRTICTELFYIGVNVYVVLLSHSFYQELNCREEV